MTWRGPFTATDGGKGDDADLAKAADMARQCIAVTRNDALDVAIEPGLLFPRDDAPAELRRAGPARADVNNLGAELYEEPGTIDCYYVRRNPDLVITREGGPILAIEIDGAWHDTPAGRKHDDRRARDYSAAGMPLLAIRLSEYPAPEHDWTAALARRLIAAMPPVRGATCRAQNRKP